MTTSPKASRWLAAASLGLCAALALSGCGRAQEAPTDVAIGAIDDAPATGAIQIWAAGDFGVTAAELFERFEAAHPETTVTVTDVPWGEINGKVSNALAAGTAPDLVLLGEVAPLIPTGGIQPVPTGVVDEGALYENAMKRSQNRSGTSYGVPWYVEARMLWYNTALAASVGAETPDTWEEQIEFLSRLSGAEGVANAIGLPVGHSFNAYQVILPFFAQAGGDPLTADRTGYNLGGEEMVTALTYYRSFFDLGLASPNGISDNAVQKFVSGATAATLQGPYLASGVDKAVGMPGFSAATFTAATMPAGAVNNAAYLGGASWVVPTDAANSDGAWKLVRWLARPEQQIDLHRITSNVPAATATWTDSRVVSDVFAKTSIAQMAHTISDVPVPSWAQVLTVIDDESEKLVRGTTTPQEAAAAIQKRAASIGLGW